MKELKIAVNLTQENLFETHIAFCTRKSDIPLTVNSIITIAYIDCRIEKVLADGTIEIIVPRTIEAFADDLEYICEDFGEEIEKIIDHGKTEDCDFLIEQQKFYFALFNAYKKNHHIEKCGNTSCGKHVNLDQEHLRSDKKVYCQHDCQTADQFIHESYL